MDDDCKLSRWEILKSQLNNLTPKEFWKDFKSCPNGILLDCRKPEELKQGKIKGAININYLAPDFWDKIEVLDPHKPYFVYCRSGRRSVRTCTLMKNGGFTKIYNLDGGLNAWAQTFGEETLSPED